MDRTESTTLSHAGLQADSATFTKTKLENNDGMSAYEIEFRKGSTEYEYSIDAYKGTILEWDKETGHDQAANGRREIRQGTLLHLACR